MRAVLLVSALLVFAHPTWATIEFVRVPTGGLQPQAAVDARGALHLIYFKGEPAAGDVFYIRRDPATATFTLPLRVNSQPNTVIAIGTVRGAHLALGKDGRPHIAWMGAGDATAGMHYARLDDAGQAFEPQRNLSQVAHELDGGGSIAADPLGHVYVAWHAGNDGEEKRRVWVARSQDEGNTFAAETPVSPEETGACGCCGMRAMADDMGRLYLLYRAAAQRIHRDMTLLVQTPGDPVPAHRTLQPWELTACPMSTAQLHETSAGVQAAWEKEGQVYWSNLAAPNTLFSPPGEGAARKHPVLAANARGETLLVWTEGTGWNQGGALAWQVFDAVGQPTAAKGLLKESIPVWGSAAAIALPDGSFTVIY
jgi:hypothetical protein